jgi:hypothetical protein
MKLADRVAMFERLHAANPAPTTELEFDTPFELLAAVLLSAQATDKSVNAATRKLFPVARSPAAILALGVEGLEPFLRSTWSRPAGSWSTSTAPRCRTTARRSSGCRAWGARPPTWC